MPPRHAASTTETRLQTFYPIGGAIDVPVDEEHYSIEIAYRFSV